MYKVLFTSDYEIHGSGMGSPYELVVEPTSRMLDLFDGHGAKLTIMADAGELLKFREWADTHGDDRFSWFSVAAQLRRAAGTGHDVQLHIHSSYFNAVWDDAGRRWSQDWSEYDLASLSYARVREMIHAGKHLLEETCRVAKPDYECFAFRAANWSMQPSREVVRALLDEGFRIDTSVFKHGKNDDLVRFDYSGAYSELVPWPVDERDVCRRDPHGMLFEFPIYAERRPIWFFVTANRLYRVLAQARSPLPAPATGARAKNLLGKAAMVLRRHPWKMDFNQCTGKQLVDGLRRVERRYGHPEVPLPFVLIGHSKTFTRHNERVLRPFLEYVADHPDRYGFGTFAELEPENYRDLVGLRRLRPLASRASPT